MGKKRKQKRPESAPAPETPGGGLGGLAAALQAQGFAASQAAPPQPERAAAGSAPAPGGELAKQPKLVLRRERKGRGGRTVTVLGGLRGDATFRKDLARSLRKALGCGASLEGEDLVLQGDVGARAKAWLESRGAGKVVLGN